MQVYASECTLAHIYAASDPDRSCLCKVECKEIGATRRWHRCSLDAHSSRESDLVPMLYRNTSQHKYAALRVLLDFRAAIQILLLVGLDEQSSRDLILSSKWKYAFRLGQHVSKHAALDARH